MDVDPGLVIWTWITFIVVFLVLRKVAWGPLRAQLEAREKRIADTIANAKNLHEEAISLLEEHREKVEKAQDEVRALLDEGRRTAERLRAETINEARDEAREILDRTKTEIEAERRRAIATIRSEAIDLALGAASKLVERSLDDADHRRLAGEAIDELVRAVEGGA